MGCVRTPDDGRCLCYQCCMDNIRTAILGRKNKQKKTINNRKKNDNK